MQNYQTGRTVTVDLEVSPILGYAYPPLYKTNIFNTVHPQILMSFSYKWLDEDKIHHVQLPDFPLNYKNDRYDDSEIAAALHKVFDEAGIVIGHNLRGFDAKMANTYFIKHNLGAPSPYKTVDTLAQARRIFKYPSNRLDEIGKFHGIGGKSDVTVGALWFKCLVEGDLDSWKLLKVYNDQDVALTEDIYLSQRGYDRSHPNMGVVLGKQGICAHCAHSSSSFQSRGIENRVNGPVRRYWCNPSKGGCGGWNYFRYVEDEDRLMKEDRPDFVAA